MDNSVAPVLVVELRAERSLSPDVAVLVDELDNAHARHIPNFRDTKTLPTRIIALHSRI